MKSLGLRIPATIAATTLLLTACAGAGSTSLPGSASAPQAIPMRDAGMAAKSNFSGQYSGTFKDSAYGKGKASASYSQFHSALGGPLTITYKSKTVSSSVAQTVSGNTVNGSSVRETGSLYCTFSETASYSAKTRVWSGSYKAVYGCSGETGTFSLKQQCYYRGTVTEDIRPDGGARPC